MMVQKKLNNYTQKEQCAMHYENELLPLRREAYAEAVDAMTVPPQIQAWSRKMEFMQLNSGAYEAHCEKNEIMPDEAEKAGWCKTLGVWYSRLPLVTAFMVIRWGEEPSKWPEQFTSEDIKRAETWFAKPSVVPGIQQAVKAGV